MDITTGMVNDHPVYKITSTTKSNRFISVFYPVNDVVETYVDMKNLYPYRFRSRQQEGSYRSDKEIVFDREKNIATFVNHKAGGERRVTLVPPAVQDPLSVVYFFRTLPAEVGKNIAIDVHDGRRNWTLVVQVLKREKVSTPAGAFNTIKVKARIKYEGLFVNKGDVLVWFTDDSSRIPVMMESKIKIGHITVKLMEKRN